MKIKALAYCVPMILVAAGLQAAAQTAKFNLSGPTNIPGTTLEPGAYTIGVVNYLSDRVILKVDGANGVHATFLGVRNGSVEKPAAGGPVRWENAADGKNYLKGWYFAGAPSAIEFVYPKEEAVAIATANPAKVPAVDPGSEGKPTDNTLSQDDMKLLTLWVLSLGEVSGSASPGIKAERYQQAMVASASPKPVVKSLPHTASLMPWVWLAGIFSLAGAALARWIMASRVRAWAPASYRG
jgi:hypothetical protein